MIKETVISHQHKGSCSNKEMLIRRLQLSYSTGEPTIL